MAHLDEVIAEINGNDTPAEDTPAVVETQTEETPAEEPKPDDTPAEEPKTEEKPAEEKPDLSQLTKEQKAEHAFKRQLSKQKERHEAEIKDLKDSFQKQFDELRESLKPKEEPKTRKDFATDDEYIRYLNREGLKEVLVEQKAQEAKEAEEKAAKDKEEKEAREAYEAQVTTFSNNSRAAFPDEEAYKAYASRVQKAIGNGLGEVLDQFPQLRDFIFKNPEGPKALDRMLQNRDDATRVLTQSDPTMVVITAHELANRQDAPAPAPAPEIPHLGKPGAKKVTSSEGSMFKNDNDLLKYVRSIGSGRFGR